MLNRFAQLPDKPVTVLIRPPISRWRLYKWYAPFGSREPSFGLLYIASYIKSCGYEVHIIDGEFLGERELGKRIHLSKPNIIGITSTTFSFNSASALTNELRSQFPNSLILLGGSHASALPEDSLKKIPALDGIIVGEGEETMLEIIQKRDPYHIYGLMWKKNSDETPVSNPLRDTVTDLDKYNLNWKLLEGFPGKYAPPFQSKKRNSASLVVSRGCFYDCSFCTATQLRGKKIRFHSPEYVIKIMSELDEDYGIKDFYFHDDYFPVYQKWMKQFCILLITLHKQYTWSCASRVESLSKEILILMKKSGCRQIGVGVESGSQKVLDKIFKKISVIVLKEGLKRISYAGISIKGYFILDTPGESLIDHLKTIKLIFKYNFSHVQFNYYVPLPGSADYYRNGGSDQFWDRMSLQHCLGYSGIPTQLFWIIEVSLYTIAYLKIVSNRIFNEVFNFRPKLSS